MLAIKQDNKLYAVCEEELIPYGDIINYEFIEPGDYEVTLPEGDYNVELYGGGGGGSYHRYYHQSGASGCAATGGSGAGFKGVIHIPEGTYTVTVGNFGANCTTGDTRTAETGGSSSIGDLITVTGGTGGYTKKYTSSNSLSGLSGKGGTVAVNTDIIGTPELNSSGRTGRYDYKAVIVISSDIPAGYLSVSGADSVKPNTYSSGYGASRSVKVTYSSAKLYDSNPGYVSIYKDNTQYKSVPHLFLYT